MDLMAGIYNLINDISKEAYPKYVIHLDDGTIYTIDDFLNKLNE